MGRSNRQDVETNRIPTEERLDLIVPRNGSRRLYVTLTEQDDEGVETPINLTGQTIVGAVKTSYQAANVAFSPSVENRDDTEGYFEVVYSAANAKGLGIDVLDCVHDLMRAPSGGGEPVRIFSGLMELSKGVA